jgi:hypothetical protein
MSPQVAPDTAAKWHLECMGRLWPSRNFTGLKSTSVARLRRPLMLTLIALEGDVDGLLVQTRFSHPRSVPPIRTTDRPLVLPRGEVRLRPPSQARSS